MKTILSTLAAAILLTIGHTAVAQSTATVAQSTTIETQKPARKIMNALTTEMKLQILASLLTSREVSKADRAHLHFLVNGSIADQAGYGVNSFDCGYIGRSMRFECEIRLGHAAEHENFDMVRIEVVGIDARPDAMLVQRAKFEVLKP